VSSTCRSTADVGNHGVAEPAQTTPAIVQPAATRRARPAAEKTEVTDFLLPMRPMSRTQNRVALARERSRSELRPDWRTSSSIGQKKIGHFGFFPRRAAHALWPAGWTMAGVVCGRFGRALIAGRLQSTGRCSTTERGRLIDGCRARFYDCLRRR